MLQQHRPNPLTRSLLLTISPGVSLEYIVFTHGARMAGMAGGGKEFVRVVSQKP